MFDGIWLKIIKLVLSSIFDSINVFVDNKRDDQSHYDLGAADRDRTFAQEAAARADEVAKAAGGT